MKPVPIEEDLLWVHLKEVPPFRALLRATESRLIRRYGKLNQPTIDLGSGDGHFASVAFDSPLPIGIDPDLGSLQEGRNRDRVRPLIAAQGGLLPLGTETIGSVVANSVLEHIPDLDTTLDEIHRVLKPGGDLILTTPSDHFGEMLFGSTLFRRARLRGLGVAYANWFNRHSRHFHTDSPQVWKERLERHGFQQEASFYYFSAASHRVFDIAHYLSLPSLVTRRVFGRWVLFPDSWVQRLWYRFLKPFYDQPAPAMGAYLLIHARKEEPRGIEE